MASSQTDRVTTFSRFNAATRDDQLDFSLGSRTQFAQRTMLGSDSRLGG